MVAFSVVRISMTSLPSSVFVTHVRQRFSFSFISFKPFHFRISDSWFNSFVLQFSAFSLKEASTVTFGNFEIKEITVPSKLVGTGSCILKTNALTAAYFRIHKLQPTCQTIWSNHLHQSDRDHVRRNCYPGLRKPYANLNWKWLQF